MARTLVSSSAEPTLTGAATVGGKAASLFRLQQLGFRVPPFFVLTADAYRADAGGRLGSQALAEVGWALEQLGGDRHAYAVRSSGLAEDSADYSYAGVFETVLDVRGVEEVILAIERCWASHRSGIAAAYRERRGITEDAAMAVVVQKMVRAQWAGVSFSADPLTQSLSVAVINAAPGLGEALVSGQINPEEIRLDPDTGRVIERRLPEGMKPLPDALRTAVLDVTCRYAQASGFPQDLEWAVEDDALYLLQSRPITTIAGVFHNRAAEPWAGRGAPDDSQRVWTRAYADEIWTPPVSVLFYDIQNLTSVTGEQLRRGGDTAPLPPDIFKYYRAAPYMDADVLTRLYAMLPPIARRPLLLPLLPPERRQALQHAPWNWRGALRRLWNFEVTRGDRWGITRNHQFLERAWPAFLERSRELADVDVTMLDEAGLQRHLNDVWALAISVGPECEIAVLYYAHDVKLLLSGLLERWCGAGEEAYGEVSAGLDASITVTETDAIWSIARSLRTAEPILVDAARTCSWGQIRTIAQDPAARAIVTEFEAFLREHRHRGANYKDVIHPRWGDDPELLWGHVQAFIESQDKGLKRPREANAASAVRRRVAQRALLEKVGGIAGPIKRAVLRALFRWNEIYAGLRDNHRFYYDYVWWLVRRHYAEIGSRLVVRGKLSRANDVFFLVRQEIAALQDGVLAVSTAAERVAVRRREWEHTRIEQPARFLRCGYVPDAESLAPQCTAHRLIGLAASAGQVEGTARIVYDVAGLSKVAAGDILVTRQTDPGWTPAFSRLGGLVLETGGVLAHGASLCREYGLPCVTAVEGATHILGDGDQIRIDGGAGTVEIVSRVMPQRI